MIFGTFVGSLADRFGRKLNCVLFGVLYSVSCLTKHINDYNALFAGRVLGGISTSILFSAFEAWMVAEHRKVRGLASARAGDFWGPREGRSRRRDIDRPSLAVAAPHRADPHHRPRDRGRIARSAPSPTNGSRRRSST